MLVRRAYNWAITSTAPDVTTGFLVTISFARADEVTKGIRYDRVIRATGFRFDHSIFADSALPELVTNDRFPAQNAVWESRNVPDLHFAGTLMQVRDFKKSTSGCCRRRTC